MKLIHTTDGEHYRRWINPIVSWLVPGSVQFLSGRRSTGVACYVLSIVCFGVLAVYLLHPDSPYSIIAPGPCIGAMFPIILAIAADSLRRPIRRLHAKGWVVLVIIWLGLPFLFALAIRTFVVQIFVAAGSSMQPTLMTTRQDAKDNSIPGDRFLVNKLAYRFSQPQRGDVIVLRTKGIKSLEAYTYMINRLAGLPGETVGIDPPYLVVNGKRVTEPEVFRRISERKDGFAGFSLAVRSAGTSATLASPSGKLTLGPNQYLVLGDNPKKSLDGRYFSPVERSAIVGKAFYICAPAGRKQRIE